MPARPSEAGPSALLVESALFAPEPVSAGLARRLLHGALKRTDRLRWADAAELALSEVVTNAVLHAHTPFEVGIEVYPGTLRVLVRDGSPQLPEQRDYELPATTGRGMALVAAVTSACGVRHLGPGGKVVWFDVGERSEPSAEHSWEVDPPHLAPAQRNGLAQVQLEQVPATLWLAARQHHDAMLRELLFHLAENDDLRLEIHPAEQAHALVSTAIQGAVDRSQQDGSARPAVPAGHPSPLPDVPDQLCVSFDVPTGMSGCFGALQDALDAAERLAIHGRLLMHPGLPEVVAVRDWVCEQVVAQLAGVAPAPWAGTAQEQFETVTHGRDEDDLGWDDSLVVSSLVGVIAADQANRIVAVSRPLADVLGWRPEDLVGRRLVTIIPPRLREAHVAGFTRHLTTGQAHLLGVPLTLPVLHADGSEVVCQFMVEQAHHGNRAVYLAWIDPI